MVHIRPLGGRPQFEPGHAYELVICALDGGAPKDYPSTADFSSRTVTADEEGGFSFEHTFDREQEYFIRLLDDQGKRINQFPVYCVDQDLAGRYPFLGDLHMHTLRSDGSQEPKVVCANYRRYGYDFFAITDHHRYYPSLEAIEFYKDVPTEFNIVPGEEIHPQPVDGMTHDMHIVNFGGEYSINALVEGIATREKGTDWRFRSLKEDCPPVMSKAEYDEMIRRRCAEADLPDGIDPYPAVGCKWVFDEIRKANGLGIFPHPNWINNVFQVPERLTDYLMETQPFDAFEVLNGVNNYETNGFQTARYYEERAKGRRFPVVGSTDSHNSLPSNPIRLSSCTIVFSPENERTALIRSTKGFLFGGGGYDQCGVPSGGRGAFHSLRLLPAEVFLPAS